MKKLHSKDELTDQFNQRIIVGIGASAGGLEAINELFDNMPSRTGFSFVVVQHLSPNHRSLMSELLTKHTSMEIREAENGTIPQPDCVYLIPSRKIITLENGRFVLHEKEKGAQPSNVIDTFFESLAGECTQKAIGIILSGTGTDGTKGIQAIKNAGGIVIAQDPISAQFDGMPNSAISTGCVDLILSPDMIPEELLEFIKEAPLIRSFTTLTNQEEGILLDILQLVYKNTGHDFTNYKRPTIHRRLAKRMAELNIKSFIEYYEHLEKHPNEIQRLVKELLLHVTQFFRDEEAFNVLEQIAIPDIVGNKENGEIIKAWTIACSTGEEVYSIAILFDEVLHRLHKLDCEVKIFATDISQSVIEFASRGVYSEEQVKNISAERLSKYFIKEAGSYRIIPMLRKMVVFAKHDVTRDPPYGHIDLLTCRNMLIYMKPVLQKTILQKAHFAIADGGYFFFGASENIGILKDVVIETDKKWKIYKCISKARVEQEDLHPNSVLRLPTINLGSAAKPKNALHHLPEIFKDTLLDEYDFAGILIDREFEVKQATGNFRKFMNFPESTFNFNLLKLVPTDLSIALSTAVRKAIRDNERVVQKKIKVVADNRERRITMIVKPYLQHKDYMQPFLFIILKEEDFETRKAETHILSANENDFGRVEELQRELEETKENLQALIEEVESANEELQSSNEEIISSNEELQSTNEELQSLNEELHTVNAEHQAKIRELVELNDDLNNYFLNTDIGQIFVDTKMFIRKFTPAATQQVNLKTSDIGRPIGDFSTNLTGVDLIKEVKSVVKNNFATEREITTVDGTNFLMRIAPYVRQNGLIDGAVINFIDIHEITKLTSILKAVFESSGNGIVGLKAIRDNKDEIIDFEFITSNSAAEKLLTLNGPFIKRRYSEFYGDIDHKILDTYKRVVETEQTAGFEFQNQLTGRWYDVTAAKMLDGLVITFSDITEKKTATERVQKSYEVLKQTSEQLKDSNYKLEQSNLDLLQFASVASHDLKEPLRKIQVFGNLLKDTAVEKLNDGETKYLNKVINATGRMQSLIDDILTLSRLSKVDTPFEEINLNKIISEIVDDLEVTVREKKAKIIVDKLPVVYGISGQMHQLFQNLISNAIKFNEREPIVTISEHTLTSELQNEFHIAASDYYGIYVKDNGIGFDPQYNDKIFRIFQRLDKTKYPGTGIGLAIVKKIIDNHKGFIKAISEPGNGTCFIIILPVEHKDHHMNTPVISEFNGNVV